MGPGSIDASESNPGRLVALGQRRSAHGRCREGRTRQEEKKRKARNGMKASSGARPARDTRRAKDTSIAVYACCDQNCQHVAVVSESNRVGCHIVAFLSFQRRGHQGDKKKPTHIEVGSFDWNVLTAAIRR